MKNINTAKEEWQEPLKSNVFETHQHFKKLDVIQGLKE